MDNEEYEDHGDQSKHRAEFHWSYFAGPGQPTALLCLESCRESYVSAGMITRSEGN